MKKYILIFVLLSITGIFFLLSPFAPIEKFIGGDKFVSIQNNKFYINDQVFYPITINYILSLKSNGKDIWVGPYNDYNYQYTTKDSSLMQLKAEMDLIKEMGFNSVRIVGADIGVDENKPQEVSIKVRISNTRDSSIILSNKNTYNSYFNALDEFFQVAENAGLKIIFLTSISPNYEITETYLRKLATHFRANTTIMAYDFFNEPLYFDKPERPKEEVYEIVKKWKHIIKMYAPNQLCTIGLEGIREVFEWDPNMLDIDFVSLHPYEYEPEQVRNEIYWYGKYIKKPWIIGETAIPADNDSVSYEDQRLFAYKTLKQAYDCGSMGYSWWQYKDVNWGVFHASYMGIVNLTGETKTKKENIPVKGTPKPVTKVFKEFDPKAKKDSCICLANYYNYSQHKDCRVKGRLLDEKNKPIQGGVILAWNEWWSHSYHTITKEDGTFEVLGDFQFYHWMASATLYSMVRGEIKPDTAKIYTDSIPTLNVGDIKLSELPFIK